MASECTCGCSVIRQFNKSGEGCQCGCECCSAEAMSTTQELAHLENLRRAVDARLAELHSVPAKG